MMSVHSHFYVEDVNYRYFRKIILFRFFSHIVLIEGRTKSKSEGFSRILSILSVRRLFSKTHTTVLCSNQNKFQAAKGFINQELKGCAEKKKFVKRVNLLAERVKKNAPVLTAPVKKCRGRKCRNQNKG